MSHFPFATPFLCLAALTWQGFLPGQESRRSTTDPDVVRKAIDMERRINQKVFEKRYQPHREGFLAASPGRWIVIAGGKLLPQKRDDRRMMEKLYFEPAKTLDEAVAAADKAAPDARHRFLFRVGEDGDYHYDIGMASTPDLLGGGFLEQLPGEVLCTGRAIHARGKDGYLQLEAEAGQSFTFAARIGTVGTPATTSQAFRLSSVFTGTVTVSRKLGEKLRLERWEIPGKVEIAGHLRKGSARRARLIMEFRNHAVRKADDKKAWHRLATPVAVWQ